MEAFATCYGLDEHRDFRVEFLGCLLIPGKSLFGGGLGEGPIKVLGLKFTDVLNRIVFTQPINVRVSRMVNKGVKHGMVAGTLDTFKVFTVTRFVVRR